MAQRVDPGIGNPETLIAHSKSLPSIRVSRPGGSQRRLAGRRHLQLRHGQSLIFKRKQLGVVAMPPHFVGPTSIQSRALAACNRKPAPTPPKQKRPPPTPTDCARLLPLKPETRRRAPPGAPPPAGEHPAAARCAAPYRPDSPGTQPSQSEEQNHCLPLTKSRRGPTICAKEQATPHTTHRTAPSRPKVLPRRP